MKKIRLFDLKISNKNQQRSLINAFKKVLNHGQFFLGPEVREFEKQISSYLKSKYSIGVASGSSALYLSLRACGIGNGDEVITTPLSWIITSNAISSCGAVPVFVDIKDDLNINEKLIEKSITKKTKAIVPMHYGGHACNMKSIMKIARKYKLFVIDKDKFENYYNLEEYGVTLVDQNDQLTVDKLNWKGEAKKSGIQMGDIISNFKIENPERPNKAIVYPFALIFLLIVGYLNYREKT